MQVNLFFRRGKLGQMLNHGIIIANRRFKPVLTVYFFFSQIHRNDRSTEYTIIMNFVIA